MKAVNLLLLLLSGITLTGCIPRIEVAAPKEPITIDMNVKIEHQITVRADNSIRDMLNRNTDSRYKEAGELSTPQNEASSSSTEEK